MKQGDSPWSSGRQIERKKPRLHHESGADAIYNQNYLADAERKPFGTTVRFGMEIVNFVINDDGAACQKDIRK